VAHALRPAKMCSFALSLLSHRYTWLLAALAALALTIYGLLYGPFPAYILSAIVAALVLFWLRKHFRILYGLIEVAVGVFTLWSQSSVGRGAFSFGFSNGFQTFQWQIALLATLGAIYIIVRGLDNIDQEWRALRQTSQ
jgi:hypothetical protein